MKKRVKIFLQTSIPIVFFSGITTLAVFLQPRNDSNFSQNFSKVNKKPLLNQINYLALGDFLSAGFDWKANLDGRGKMSEGGTIARISFPAFFANFAQSIKSSSVKSFKNLALKDSGAQDWLYFLDPKNNVINESSLSNFKTQIYNKSNFAEAIRFIFGNFDGDFSKLTLEIRKANLISISVGYKDFLESFNSKFFSNLKLVNLDEHKKNEAFKAKVNKVFATIRTNLTKIVELIKKVNPDAYINLIGYYSDQPKIQKYLNDLAKSHLLDINPEVLSIARLNKEIEQVAEFSSVNYVYPFTQKKWDESRELFFDQQMNFAPQIKGHKQIAQNLILSLTLESKEQENSGLKTDLNKVISTNFTNNTNDSQQIYLGSNKEILDKLTLNGSLESFVNKDSNFEKTSIKELQTKDASAETSFYASSILTKITAFFDSEENQFVKIIKQLVENFGDKASPNFTAFNNLVGIIFKSKFFSTITDVAQDYLLNSFSSSQNGTKSKEKDNQESNSDNNEKSAELFDVLKEKAFNEKAILELLKEVLSSSYVQKNQFEIISLFYNLIFRQSTIINMVVEFFSKNPVYKNLVSKVLNFNTVQKFFTFILTELIKNYSDYSTVTSFKELLYIFLQNSNNYKKSINFIQNFVIEALKKPDFLNSILDLLSSQFGFNIGQEDQKSLITLVTSISDILVKTQTFKNLTNLVASEIILGLKISAQENDGDWSFFGKILANVTSNIKNFFKDKNNIYNLFQDLLNFSPSVKQLASIKLLVSKFLPFITKIKIQFDDFFEVKNIGFNSLNLVFDSFMEFLSANNFQQLTKLINGFLADFFIINNLKYRNSLDFNGLFFNFLSNNSELLRQILRDFIYYNRENSQILEAIISIISKIVDNNGLNSLIPRPATNVINEKEGKINYLVGVFFNKIQNLTNQYNVQIEEINSKLQKAINSEDSAELIKNRNDLKTFFNVFRFI